MSMRLNHAAKCSDLTGTAPTGSIKMATPHCRPHTRGTYHALPSQQESPPHFAGVGGALVCKVHGSPVALDRPLHRAGLPGNASSQVCTLPQVLRREERLLGAQELLRTECSRLS